MTFSLSGSEVAKQITEQFPEVVTGVSDTSVMVKSESLIEVATFLKTAPSIDFDYLASILPPGDIRGNEGFAFAIDD